MWVAAATVAGMSLSLEMITFDALDPRALAAWWGAQLGGEVRDDNDGWFVVLVLPEGPALGFQKVTDPTPGKNRVHLDLRSQDSSRAIEQLLGNGASLVAEHEEGSLAWSVLADPDGNQFCLART